MRTFIFMILFVFLSSSCGVNDEKKDSNFLFINKNAKNTEESSGALMLSNEGLRDSHTPTPVPIPTPGFGANLGNLSLPQYQPILNAFPNISELMSSSNTANTLLKLTRIASPTLAYHRDLENVLSAVATTDMAHVKILMDAVYFSYLKYLNIAQELKYLKDSGAGATDLAHRLEVEQTIAASLGGTLTNIANAGFQKATDLNLENGVEALKLVFPASGASWAFVTMLKRAGSLSTAQKDQVMMLASEKYAPEVASDLAMDIFNANSDKSLKAFLELTDRLQWSSRDFTLIKGSKLFSRFTYEDVQEILRHQYSKDGTVALAVYAKSAAKSHSHVCEIAKELTSYGKEHFINNILPFYQTITTQEMQQLCQLAQSACSDVILKSPQLWQNPTTEDAVHLSQFLAYSDKDQWLASVGPYITSPSGSQVFAFADAGYFKKRELAEQLFPKAVSKSVADIVGVSSILDYGEKDKWVYFALELIPTLSSRDLYSSLNAAYAERVKIGKKYISRVNDLLPASIAKISNDLFDYGDKDKWLKAAVIMVNKLSASELKTILQTSYNEGVVIAQSLLDKVSDLTASKAADIANAVFSYGDKDKWLKNALPHIAFVTIPEATAILDASYSEGAAISVALLDKTGDLTVANAVTIAEHLSYGAKDIFLLKAIDGLTDLTRANLDLIVNAAYYNENQVRKKALERLGNLAQIDILLLGPGFKFPAKNSSNGGDRIVDRTAKAV